jgi:hypothetical protein
MFSKLHHDDRDRIERARQSDILAVAQRYGAELKRAGGREFVGPCPVCGGRDRFSLNTKKRVWNCRGCDKGGDVINLAQHLSGETFAEAVATLSGEEWILTNPPAHRRRDDADDHDASRNGALAARIWDAARSIKGTLAERYLVRVRGIDIEQVTDVDDVLRFAPSCPFGGDKLPCLVALVRDVVTDEPMGITRTALDGDGRKIDRMGLGPKKGGAIKLWPDVCVTTGLVVGEELEATAAAATCVEYQGTLLQPAWALIDRVNLRDFPFLTAVEALTVLVGHNADGQDAANVYTRRWLGAGRHVHQFILRGVDTGSSNIAAAGGVR